MNYPDANNHFFVSMIKSSIRMAGYGFILIHIETAVVFLILSEVLGIFEELV